MKLHIQSLESVFKLSAVACIFQTHALSAVSVCTITCMPGGML